MGQRVLVTGSNGQLGSELKDIAQKYPDMEFLFLSRSGLSIDNEASVRKIVNDFKPSYLVNCAAYTAVDKAESEKELAFTINGTAVENLAKLSREFGIKLIHISTDYVFDGSADHPLSESAPVHPVNVYGESKLLGEELCTKANPDAIIIRTSWVYSFHGKNFVKTMIRLMKEKESINVVGDQFGSPTYAADLAESILAIIKSGKWEPGIFHFSNNGVISWYDFACAIKELIGSSCNVHSIPTEQYPTPAKRPKYSVMDKSKIQRTYGIDIKPWHSSLKECIDKLNAAPAN